MQIHPTKSYSMVAASGAVNKPGTVNCPTGCGQTNDKLDLTGSNSVADIAVKYDVRNISPREMAQMSQELYDKGTIDLKLHAILSFQEELSPSFDQEIGRMLGRTTQPDLQHDYVNKWEEQLEFQKKSGVPADMLKLTKEVVNLLKNFESIHKHHNYQAETS